MYDRVIGALGPELSILGEVPVEDIARAESSVLAEAITRLRAGEVIREAGYDGEYGVIRLFEDGELDARRRHVVRRARSRACRQPSPALSSRPRTKSEGRDPSSRNAGA